MNSGYEVVAVIALGMGGAFWLTDRASPTSRALALFLALLGATVFGNAQVGRVGLDEALPAWLRGVPLLDAATFIAACEWGLRVSRTVSDASGRRRRTLLIRSAELTALGYALAAALWPELRYRALAGALAAGRLPPPEFLLLLAPALLAGLLVLIAGAMLLGRRPDQAERVRIVAALAAMPFLSGALLLPSQNAPLALAVGELMFLIGALRYYMIQGARGMFMAQFLSPQVAELVRRRGLRHAMARKRSEVCVVCCDIRDFTAHAQQHTPEDVMRLLRAFYAAVAAAVEDYGGTVKDLAGDGALILIGAPVPYADRAQRGIALARRLQSRVRPVVRRYSPALGLGVGVASGSVAVGIVGDGGRYEYMAVGPSVNLASRLCDKAADGEIHIDEATLIDSGESLPAQRRIRSVKGIAAPVTTYVLREAALRPD